MNGLCLEERKGVKWDTLAGRGDIVRLLLKKWDLGKKGSDSGVGRENILSVPTYSP